MKYVVLWEGGSLLLTEERRTRVVYCTVLRMETEDSVNTGTSLTVGASTKSTHTGSISGATSIVCAV